MKKRDFAITGSGIDVVEKVSLGGVDQSILIQAENPNNPVLLFVHGGPCMPVPGVALRGQDYGIAITTKNLVKHFVLVFWDQRGAGKSYDKSIPSESIRVEQYIRDCNELIELLRGRFSQEKVFLAAHSWGTVIGLSIASRYPEKLYAYVGISQIINWAENDQFCYKWVKSKAENANDVKTLKKLEAIGTPPYTQSVKQWTELRSLLMKYKSMVYETDIVKHPGMIGVFKIFLRARDYSIKDIYHTFKGSYDLTYTQALIEDFSEIDFRSIYKFDVPVFFFHGKHDFHLDGKAVQEFVDQLETPYRKEMIWYKHSAHMFHPEEASEIEKYVIEVVKEYRKVL